MNKLACWLLGTITLFAATPQACCAADPAVEPVEFHRVPTRLVCYPDPENIPEGESAIFDVTYSHDGTRLVTGDTFGHVLLWTVGRSEPTRCLIEEHESPVRHVRFSSDDQYIVSQDIDGKVLVWSTESGKLVQRLKSEPIEAIDTTAGGLMVALTVSAKLQQWSFTDGEKPLVLTESSELEHPFQKLSIGSKAKQLLLASESRWELRSLDGHNVIGNGEAQKPITSLRMTAGGDRFAIGLQDGSIVVLSADGQEIANWSGKHPKAVSTLVFSHTGKTLLSGCLKNRIRFWDLQARQPNPDLDIQLPVVTSVAVSPDNRHVAVAGIGNQLVCLKTLNPAKTVAALKRPKAWNQRALFAVSVLPDKQQITIVPKSSTAEILDLAGKSVKKGKPIDNGKDDLMAAAIAPSGKFSAHGYRSGLVRIYDVQTDQPISEHRGQRKIRLLRFAPQQDRLAIISLWNESLRVIDPVTGEVIFKHSDAGYPLNHLAWTSDGKTLITLGHRASDQGRMGVVAKWSSDSGELIKETESKDIIGHFAISPDDSAIVTGGRTGIVCVYDDELNFIKKFEVGGRGGIHRMKLIDNRRLVVGTFKGSVLLVDIETGGEQARFEPLPYKLGMPIRALELIPEKNLLVAVGGFDFRETMRIYSLDGIEVGQEKPAE